MNLKMTAEKRTVHHLDPKKTFYGHKFMSWKALDYYPYERGIGWYISFSSLTFGSALIIFLMDPVSSSVPVASICIIAAFYLWVHREGENEHQISLYENGIEIGESSFITWKNFKGYWFIEDHHSRLLVLESDKWNQDRIRILLGNGKTEKINRAMEKIGMKLLADKKENGFDLWSRVFRL